MKNHLHLFCILLVLFFSACSSIRSDYYSAKKINSIEGYKRFLKKHHYYDIYDYLKQNDKSQELLNNDEVKYSVEVRSILDSLEWIQVKSNWENSIEAYKQYITEHEYCNFKPKIVTLIDSLEWNQTKQSNNLTQIDSYIMNHQKSAYIKQAEEFREKLVETTAWNDCLKIKSLESFGQFKRNYPKSFHIKEIDQYIGSMENSEWVRLSVKGNIRDLYYFLELYPNSNHINDIQKIIQAFKQKTKEQIPDYMDALSQALLSSFFAIDIIDPNNKYIGVNHPLILIFNSVSLDKQDNENELPSIGIFRDLKVCGNPWKEGIALKGSPVDSMGNSVETRVSFNSQNELQFSKSLTTIDDPVNINKAYSVDGNYILFSTGSIKYYSKNGLGDFNMGTKCQINNLSIEKTDKGWTVID